MKRYVFIVMAALAAPACSSLENGLTPFTPRQAEELFTGKSETGVYDGGIKVWEFDQTRHQLIFSRNIDPETGRLRFTIQADDLSRILSVTFPTIYSENGTVLTPVGTEIEIDVAARGIERIADGRKKVKVVKLQNDDNRQSIWLWDAREQLGYMILTDL